MTDRPRAVRETVALYHAKTHLSELVERAAEGEEIGRLETTRTLADAIVEVERLTLVTRDRVFARYDVRTIRP